ncbi:hypothetical protein SLEP1_g257 [Rubroshorea leprosula]|uniref:PCI domain-containing protein n=1 Tax=Rubroshorea leprosula TaxID=152421 RepID=A0AAV5HKE3_9ROSI|nr:hypothetical protein SLEP1_g257 [Rubroshorea leprosula]
MAGFGKGSSPKTEVKLPNPFAFLRQYSAPPSTAIRPTRAFRNGVVWWGEVTVKEHVAPYGVRLPSVSFERNHPTSSSCTESLLGWSDGQRSPIKEYDAQTNPRPTTAMSLIARRGSEISVSAKISQFPELKRTRSPTTFSSNEDVSSYSDLIVNGHDDSFLQTTHPPSAFESKFHPTFGYAQRPALPSSLQQDNHAKLPANLPNLLACQNQSLLSSHDLPIKFLRSILSLFKMTLEGNEPIVDLPCRPSASSPRLDARSNVLLNTHDSQISQSSQGSLPVQNNKVSNMDKITCFPVSKRTRSPPLTLQDKVLQANPSNKRYDNERGMQAKAKWLACFKPELSEALEMRQTNTSNQKISANRHQQSMEERRKIVGDCSIESVGDFIEGNASTDFEGSLETSSVIVGLCPDMCPEAERAERERKGDLDQYEPLDGDRNQTSKLLAVKKYNRTAEREVGLIRPMPVLQKTIDYLLDLLDQPYDDRFLGMYNFLWDRMRAIRMDLTMQHIFDQGAITMLEQMIRLHIVAMHDIEQMNKTSVELFQMYDDHRKKGINMPTEKEFRGYYALLKLDKHPGYKVEPAELSLDLAKMTTELRQTPEVLFARDVARACRTGNFVAFFRLARKASYLQACLMHAHFAKLRTQALASLHSSLQSN